jgi:hypothetical protein
LRIVSPPPTLLVSNLHPEAVAAIWVKPCDAPSASYRALAETSVPFGETCAIPIEQLPACADLSAMNAQGESLGVQTGLRVVPGTNWTIR